jgi:NAD(P)-dependent dehydrogenase (short-subunit alcohol dehydrogenase family)
MSALSSRIVLITGAAGGVGAATVEAVCRAGGHVIAVDVNESALRRVAGTDAVQTTTLDVGDESAWRRLAEQIDDSWGRLDGLVTCAAVLHAEDGGLESVSHNAWSRTLDINVKGVMLASRAALPLMRAAGRGSIVHIGSITASRGSATAQMAYTTSKGAVESLAREMAVAYAGHGVRVNTVAAGLIETPLTAGLIAAPEELARRLAHIPMGRLGRPQEIAQAATWLLSDDASYVTGATLAIDGGLSAAFVTGRE